VISGLERERERERERRERNENEATSPLYFLLSTVFAFPV